MPSRTLTLAIIAFWLGSTFWLFQRELRPLLWPGGPPPYTIDLADEAQTNASTRWSIFKDGKKQGYSQTNIRYRPRDDSFELHGEFKFWTTGRVSVTSPNLILRSMVRVSREGELKEVTANLQYLLNGIGQIEGQITGEVRDGQFVSQAILLSPIRLEQSLKPVPVQEGVSVLNPLQPLNRLPNLHRGQQWRIALIDPLTDLVRKYMKELTGDSSVPETRWLEAEVSTKTRLLTWGPDDESVECLVIEYHGEDTQASTWVRASDGLVLQQEINQNHETLLLVRD